MFKRNSAPPPEDLDQEESRIKEAVGISYDEDKRTTPVISSKGEGAMADAIVDMAKELGIYVHQDQQLLNQLKCLKEGEEIPRELFEVIAQILAFSYMLQGKTPQAYTRPDGSRRLKRTERAKRIGFGAIRSVTARRFPAAPPQSCRLDARYFLSCFALDEPAYQAVLALHPERQSPVLGQSLRPHCLAAVQVQGL